MKLPRRNGSLTAARLTAARLAVAGAGLVSLTLGIAQGGYRDTLGKVKAVRICLECIHCGGCAQHCPQNAIYFGKERKSCKQEDFGS